MSEGIRDVGVSLQGQWSDSEAYRLTELLKQMDQERPSRESSIREFTDQKMLVFKTGKQFEFAEETEFYPNPAAIFGSGISSTTTLRFQVPMNASDEEIKAMILPHLPDRLAKSPARLKAWQKMVGSTKKNGSCASFLRLR